ncbi:ribose-phosphate pyrophosphokinase [Aeropyrum pernix]|uniref:Ribose-phosphate pyrophosphokinase n=1 Tax=Aeropyrum pernix TaxID=56636 RepID=A0A401H8V6_AERPX|nr:ribose-phosphate pyrophosphokinase [Aeropyrum pernix]GBF08906.1 ribose-phosphate pyrophosphokinase [Aeropyrum pernix]
MEGPEQWVIVGGWGSASAEFSEGLSRNMGLKLVKPVFKLFPDEEEYVRIEGDISGFTGAIVVQSFERPASRSLVYSLLIADALKEAGVSRIVLMAPYMGYTRQDRVFLPGEPVSVRAVMRALTSSGYNALASIEVHKEYVLDYFDGSTLNIFPFTYMLKETGIPCGDNTIIVAPDKGSLPRVERLARETGCRSYGYLVKERDRITGEVRLAKSTVDPRGKDAIVVDDIISTGGTIALASRWLLENGANSVFVLAAHYLGIGNAEEKMMKAGVSRVVTGNTLPRKPSKIVTYVDLTGLAAGQLTKLVSNL